MAYRFSSQLWRYSDDEPGSWHFTTLPEDLAAEIRDDAGPPRGFGSVRVAVRIGSSSWSTSLFPDARRGSLVLPVKKPVREAEGLEAGDEVEVELRLVD